MLLGLGSYIFRYSIGTDNIKPNHPLDAIGIVEKAADLGAELVQFADNLPLDHYDQDSLVKVRSAAERRGVILEGGTAGATEDRLLRHLEIATILNAKLIRVAPHAPDEHLTWDEILQAIRKVLPKYENEGITIGIENHFTMKSEDLASLVKNIDHPLVGVCVDTGNSIAQQEWPMETVNILAPYAKSLHLKDFKLEMHPDGLGVNVRGAPLGQGNQDVKKVLSTIQHAVGDVNVVLEQWMPPCNTIQETVEQEEQWIRKGIEHTGAFLTKVEK